MSKPLTPTAPTSALRHEAQHIMRAYPTLRAGMMALNEGQRAALTELAAMCGLPLSVRNKMNAADLLSVYLVALKDGAAAVQVAQKVATRIDDPLGLNPPDATPNPTWKPRTARRPTAKEEFDPLDPPQVNEDHSAPPVTAPGLTESDVRRIAKDEDVKLALGLMPPLQAAITAMGEDFTQRIGRCELEAAKAAVSIMRDTIHDAAAEILKSMKPTVLEVVTHGAPPVPLGLVHHKQAALITMLGAGVNVYLHGPAGSGKTTAGQKCAEAFLLTFYFAAKVESEYQLLGFKDARGDTVRTQFREAYEHGGVFLFDEMDASSSAAVVALNAALANGVCPFPDGIVKRHKDFICIGAGNTALSGATRQYVGRNQLDAASIDRFAFLEWGYDDQLEHTLATDQTWCKYVQAVRAAIKERGLNHLVTPRATYDGCKLLASGDTWEDAADAVIWKGLDRDTVKQIEAAIDYSREVEVA